MKYPYKKLPRSSNTALPQVAMPFLPVVLYRGELGTMPIYALLDSGADGTIMPSDLAPALGIDDFKKGILQPTFGVGQQKVDVFIHSGIEIKLVGDDRRLPVDVGFIETTPERRIVPLLGRTFFSHFKVVTFRESKEIMELKV